MRVITGATGGVGGEAVRLLAEGGYPMRLLVRDPARAPKPPQTEVVQGAYDDPEALARALQPGDEVFMVSIDLPHDARMKLHRSFIDAAAKAGVGHIVYLSFMCAGPEASFLHAQAHGETEALIAATGIPHTFLRTSFYDKVTTMFFTDGEALGPGGQGAVSWVSREDCGAVVAAVMRDPQAHAGKIYDVSGPQALSLADTSALISQLTGSRYRYVEEDPDLEELAKALPPGASAHFLKYRRSAFVGIARGEFGIVSDAVERLTGRSPRSLKTFVEQNLSAYPPSKG